MTYSAGDVGYEASGQGYAKQRRTDPRIAAFVHAALGDARTVLNVGAGAGSYEPEDRYVIAIEPSATMRAQRARHLSPAIKGIAEELPLDDKSVDASIAMITVHQWKDLTKGLSELRRVTRGAIVILTFDGDALKRYWLMDYVPELIEAEMQRYVPINSLCASLRINGRVVTATPIEIPLDCSDGIIEAYYGRPERLLDATVRKAQSSWGFVSEDVHRRFVTRLTADLRAGHWNQRYGFLRRQPTYEGSCD